MMIDLRDPRLTRQELHTLRTIFMRMAGGSQVRPPVKPPELPKQYTQELDRVFGSYGEEGAP